MRLSKQRKPQVTFAGEGRVGPGGDTVQDGRLDSHGTESGTLQKSLSEGETWLQARASETSQAQGSSEGLVKTQIPGAYPETVVQQSWGLRICISDELLGDAAATCLWASF